MVNDGIVSSADGAVNRIALKVLLILYVYQRATIESSEVLSFGYNGSSDTKLESAKLGRVLQASNYSVVDIFRALRYLKSKKLISFREDKDSSAITLWNIEVDATGIDIIEGVGHNKEATKEFNIAFNLKLADNITLDSLIKNEVGFNIESIIKNSVI